MIEIIIFIYIVFIIIIMAGAASMIGGGNIKIFTKIRGTLSGKRWKVKEEGSMCFLFGQTLKYFNNKDEAIQFMKEDLPRGGIMSQATHDKLFERIGLRWHLRGCYIRDTRYYKEKGEDLAEPLDEVVKACEHVKKHCDKGTSNQMFGIRASWLRMHCKRGCKLNAFHN